MQYASINGNGYLGYGELVYGTKGTLALEKEEDLKLLTGSGDEGEGRDGGQGTGGGGGPTLDTQSSGPARKAAGGAGGGPVSRGYAEELEHWAWCIRHPARENQPRCHPRVAMADAIIALTTNLAVRTGQPIRFKPEWFDPDEGRHARERPEDRAGKLSAPWWLSQKLCQVLEPIGLARMVNQVERLTWRTRTGTNPIHLAVFRFSPAPAGPAPAERRFGH